MPTGTSPHRVKAIEGHRGATVVVLENGNYDDGIRLAHEQAKKRGWLVLQDTASVTDPAEVQQRAVHVLQGYATVMSEALEQIEAVRPPPKTYHLISPHLSPHLKAGSSYPTHVFLQCGVGAFASSSLATILERLPKSTTPPIFVMVEPHAANCYYKSLEAGKKIDVNVKDDTIMAGLACGVPSTSHPHQQLSLITGRRCCLLHHLLLFNCCRLRLGLSDPSWHVAVRPPLGKGP